jgi:hypothetical protein
MKNSRGMPDLMRKSLTDEGGKKLMASKIK